VATGCVIDFINGGESREGDKEVDMRIFSEGGKGLELEVSSSRVSLPAAADS
jgi:hypothetical protein